MSQDTILAVAELDSKYGCLDLQGKTILPFDYDAVGLQSEGLLPVNKGGEGGRFLTEGGKWGYCDANGVLKIDLKFDKAESFSEGLAAVLVSGKWGFINLQGDFVVKPVLKKAERFSEGLASVQNEAGKWGFINRKGQQEIDFKFDYAEIFEDGLCVVFIGEMPEEDDEYGEMIGLDGLIDKTGNYVCEAKYLSIGSFHNGLAVVKVQNPEISHRTKSGFINRKGELKIPAKYDYAEDFSDGLAKVAISVDLNKIFDFKVSFIDSTGHEVISQVNHNSYSKNGLFFVSTETSRPGRTSHTLMDKKGNVLLTSNYFLQQIDTNLFIASDDESFGHGLINIAAEIILPFEFINMHYLGEGLLGFEAIFDKTSGVADLKNGVIDINGNILFKTDEFEIPRTDEDYSIKHGIILGRVGRIHYKFGFVDKTGKWVIPPIYDSIGSFEKVN